MIERDCMTSLVLEGRAKRAVCRSVSGRDRKRLAIGKSRR